SPRNRGGEGATNDEAAALTGCGLDASARGVHDMLDDREAEPASCGGAGAVASVEALEQTRNILLGDPTSVVTGLEDGAGRRFPARERERGPRTGVADSVLGEIFRHGLEHSLPEGNGDGRAAVDAKRHFGVVRP